VSLEWRKVSIGRMNLGDVVVLWICLGILVVLGSVGELVGRLKQDGP
jgi:hypothetical protein